MVISDITHVAIMPPVKPEAGLIDKVAGIIDKDLYSTGLLLAGKMPRLIAHYHSAIEAEASVKILKGLGLTAFSCGDTFLRTPTPAAFSPRILVNGGSEIEFRNLTGISKKFGSGDVFLILKGKAQLGTDIETTETKRKFSVSKTIVMGGIPMWSKVKEKTVSKSTEIKSFVRLYILDSTEPAVEITQHSLDYGYLNEKLASSSLINFNTAIAELRTFFTEAIFDDRLTAIEGTNTGSVTAGSDTEVNCKLLYLYYKELRTQNQ